MYKVLRKRIFMLLFLGQIPLISLISIKKISIKKYQRDSNTKEIQTPFSFFHQVALLIYPLLPTWISSNHLCLEISYSFSYPPLIFYMWTTWSITLLVALKIPNQKSLYLLILTLKVMSDSSIIGWCKNGFFKLLY